MITRRLFILGGTAVALFRPRPKPQAGTYTANYSNTY